MPPARATRPISSRPSRQFTKSESGSITISATKDAQFSRKNDSHRPAMPLAPSSMIFSRPPEWVGAWKLQGRCST